MEPSPLSPSTVPPAARYVVSDSRAQAARFSSLLTIQVDTGSKWLLIQVQKRDRTRLRSQESSPLQIESLQSAISTKARESRRSGLPWIRAKQTQSKRSGKMSKEKAHL